jgi:hypothetical protein
LFSFAQDEETSVDAPAGLGTADEEVASLEVKAQQVAEVAALMQEAGMDAQMLAELEEQMQQVDSTNIPCIVRHARYLAGSCQDKTRALVHTSMMIYVRAWVGL